MYALKSGAILIIKIIILLLLLLLLLLLHSGGGGSSSSNSSSSTITSCSGSCTRRGDGVMNVKNVRSWVRQYKEGRTSCDNEPKQSRPRTSRSENMVERVETAKA
jgi:hypothetical protein